MHDEEKLRRIAREFVAVAGPNNCPPAPHACPKCEIYHLLDTERQSVMVPESGTEILCMLCAHVKPWGVFHEPTGAAVCRECRDGARLAPQLASLEAKILAAREILATIVCTEHPDDGVVLLSNDGPCHWDEELKCQVYDHDHFSPLGDALMKLWKELS